MLGFTVRWLFGCVYCFVLVGFATCYDAVGLTLELMAEG